MKRYIRLQTGQIIDTQSKKWLGCYEREITDQYGRVQKAKAFYFRDVNVPYGVIIREADKPEYLAKGWDIVYRSHRWTWTEWNKETHTYDKRETIERGYVRIGFGEDAFCGSECEWKYRTELYEDVYPKDISEILACVVVNGNPVGYKIVAYKQKDKWIFPDNFGGFIK